MQALRNEKGATSVEYALIAFLITSVVAAAVGTVGLKVVQIFVGYVGLLP
jgi:Flp pilus assembly pilin Flp